MESLRIIVSTLVAAGLLWLLLGTILGGLRTGRIHYLDSTSTCDRNSRPLLFWFLVLVFAALSVFIAAAWWQSVLD
jgi:lipid-A-disaccharide synthase-like uncharacterized protein